MSLPTYGWTPNLDEPPSDKQEYIIHKGHEETLKIFSLCFFVDSNSTHKVLRLTPILLGGIISADELPHCHSYPCTTEGSP